LVAAQLLADLGIIMQRRSRFEDAQEALRAAIESRTATLGPEHADTLAVRFRWAAVLQDLARHGESRAELAVLQPAVEAQFGAGSLELAEVLTQSSYASSLAGEHDSAEAMLVRARAIVDALAEDHAASALTRESRSELRANIVVGLGNVLLRAKRREEAEPIVNEAYALHRAMWGDDDPRTLETRQNRAVLWRQLRRFPESRAEFEAALAAQRRL
jgi:tetratricopeptide (TPR) repeat protein